jgi:methyl-accepting chemotaxis protein
MDRTLTLAGIRHTATRLFVCLCLFHVPVVAVVAVIARNPFAGPAGVALIIALLAACAAWRLQDGLPLRCLMAAFLTCGPVLIVYAGRGHASGFAGNGDWQIDYHMYFFVIFAMLAAYIDWRPIAVAATLTAAHHLILDLLVPATVFPEEGLDRVLVHALAVLAECSVLFWLTLAIERLFARVQEANSLVDFTAQETAEQLAREHAENAELRRRLQQYVKA